MNELISLSFWFNSRPEPIGDLGQKIIAIIASIMGLVFIIIAIRAYSEKLNIYKPSIDKLLPFCVSNFIISLYIWFVNYQLIPVLRARFWYIIWSLVVTFWLILIIKDFYKRSKKRQELAKDLERRKYLP